MAQKATRTFRTEILRSKYRHVWTLPIERLRRVSETSPGRCSCSFPSLTAQLFTPRRPLSCQTYLRWTRHDTTHLHPCLAGLTHSRGCSAVEMGRKSKSKKEEHPQTPPATPGSSYVGLTASSSREVILEHAMRQHSAGDALPASNFSGSSLDRSTLAQCLNATSQIAAECNRILRELLMDREYVLDAAEMMGACLLVSTWFHRPPEFRVPPLVQRSTKRLRSVYHSLVQIFPLHHKGRRQSGPPRAAADTDGERNPNSTEP